MKKDFAGKAQDEQVIEALTSINGYRIFSNSADKKGDSGTAILTQHELLSVHFDMDIAEHDQEGRGTVLEFKAFYLITVYTPLYTPPIPAVN